MTLTGKAGRFNCLDILSSRVCTCVMQNRTEDTRVESERGSELQGLVF